MELENKISLFINRVSQRDLLLGKCESEDSLTSTQEHILMLLSKNQSVTSSYLAEELGISAAAISKAIKVLQDHNFIKAERRQNDERVVALYLTEKGMPIASEHAEHHDKTLAAYKQILSSFNSMDQKVIAEFISKLEEVFS
ncbi:MAG: MarR family transcriptional regulator [Streptococcaceae bacterium]|jgi:DNA-binding MarR family transcriptional regulator|nr:MarR family transcriptional regulator [Streptococcaceae bacterium]